jgi:S-adenosylmethionine/arginine decarboxylase-like enzyme
MSGGVSTVQTPDHLGTHVLAQFKNCGSQLVRGAVEGTDMAGLEKLFRGELETAGMHICESGTPSYTLLGKTASVVFILSESHGFILATQKDDGTYDVKLDIFTCGETPTVKIVERLQDRLEPANQNQSQIIETVRGLSGFRNMDPSLMKAKGWAQPPQAGSGSVVCAMIDLVGCDTEALTNPKNFWNMVESIPQLKEAMLDATKQEVRFGEGGFSTHVLLAGKDGLVSGSVDSHGWHEPEVASKAIGLTLPAQKDVIPTIEQVAIESVGRFGARKALVRCFLLGNPDNRQGSPVFAGKFEPSIPCVARNGRFLLNCSKG